MISEERLVELETLHRYDSHPMRAELAELVAAYRKAPGLSVSKGDDGAWLHFTAPTGRRAAISVSCLAAERGDIVSSALIEWADSIPKRQGSREVEGHE